LSNIRVVGTQRQLQKHQTRKSPIFSAFLSSTKTGPVESFGEYRA
jgi:hypothetical protein